MIKNGEAILFEIIILYNVEQQKNFQQNICLTFLNVYELFHIITLHCTITVFLCMGVFVGEIIRLAIKRLSKEIMIRKYEKY